MRWRGAQIESSRSSSRSAARARTLLLCAVCLAAASLVSAQQLLDRVVARVNGAPITLTDVRAAIAFGIVEAMPGGDQVATATQQLIDRQLLLAEVARFPPPEPPAADVDKQLAEYKAHAGSQLSSIMQSTGYDEQRLRQAARDSVRIQAYLVQRFGTASVVTDDEVQQYYDAHPKEFTRNGRLLPLEAVETDVRQRASAERRRTTIAQWIRDLHGRADIVEVEGPVK